MILDTDFRGHIFQFVEALDYGDAVSNYVIAMEQMLRNLGMSTSIHSKWHHENVQSHRKDFEVATVTEFDLVILHYAGFSEFAFPQFKSCVATKICCYHNITPHEFFEPSTNLYKFCLLGRKQLAEVIESCHYYWGVSNYNVLELIEKGAQPDRCSVVPIVVPYKSDDLDRREETIGNWLFCGRVAPNKCQHELIEVFSEVRARRPELARKLTLVGRYDRSDPYYQKVVATVEKLNLQNDVEITGKVADDEVDKHFNRASIYVSVSQHEGFGVPLIEASHYKLPVVALDTSAVAETLGVGEGVCVTRSELLKEIVKVLSDSSIKNDLILKQTRNAKRFSAHAVERQLANALRVVLPRPYQFTSVSVVICTYNRSDLLERCLDYLADQSNQNFEVIVVNGPSTDSTQEVLSRYAGKIKVGTNPERNLSVSRNIGIELSSGDLIAFIDDDALPYDDWIDVLLKTFNKCPNAVGGLGGPVFFAGSLEYQAQETAINKFAQVMEHVQSSTIGKNGWVRTLLGTNACFTSQCIKEVGGYDEQFDYFLDESELCYRLQIRGWIVAYSADLVLRHEFAKSENRLGKYQFNWFAICKNIAYFIAAYSGLKDAALRKFVEQKISTERIEPLRAAYAAGEITKEYLNDSLRSIERGVAKGFDDAREFPKTRAIAKSESDLRVFTHRASHALVGKDVRVLHICIVTKEFPPFAAGGGIGTLYYHLASELLLMGHQVTVIVPGNREIYKRGKFSVVYAAHAEYCADDLPAPGFRNNINWALSALKALAGISKNGRVDVVDSALWDSEALAISMLPRSERPAVVVRLVTPFPVVARTNRWSVGDLENALFRKSEVTLIENADAVVPISKSIANTIQEEYELQADCRWEMSHCGIAYWSSFDFRDNYDQLAAISNVDVKRLATSRIILFVGRLESRKGVDVLIDAAGEFLRPDTKSLLVIAGRDVEGWEGRAKDRLHANVLGKIIFLGEIDDVLKQKLLNVAYCVVFPSRYESFGLVPLEAFVHGTPVIAARAGAIPEVVENEVCGLLFEPGQASSLANCVRRLLDSDSLRVTLSNGARRQSRRFGARASAVRAINLYQRLIVTH